MALLFFCLFFFFDEFFSIFEDFLSSFAKLIDLAKHKLTCFMDYEYISQV